MIRLQNMLFGTHPVVAHCPGPLHEGWSFFAGAVAGTPVPSRPARESATILTWNNGLRPEKPGGVLEQCLARHGCAALVLGQGLAPWWNAVKLRLTADALRHVTTEFVVGLDSADVLLVDHPDVIVSRFREHFACDLLFNSTGSFCWPELPRHIMFERSLPGAAPSQGRCWMNSGAFVGRTDFCRSYFAAMAQLAEDRGFSDDQWTIKYAWPDWYPRVQLDYQCQIFQWFNESRRVLHIERPRAERQVQLIEWLRHVEPLRFGVEVGVFDGYTSDILLQEFPELLLWLVDLWQPVAPFTHIDAAGFEQIRRCALWWTSHADDRRYELRMDSAAAAELFPESSLDFAFIDADHYYESVRRDLQAWWPRVRPGGLLCGHDYGVYADATGEWGVRRAVDEFTGLVGRQLRLGPDGMWCLVK